MRLLLGVLLLLGGCFDQDFIKVALVAPGGEAPAIDTIEVTLNGGEAVLSFPTGEPAVIPSPGSEDALTFNIDFSRARRGEPVALDVRGFRNGEDVLSGSGSAIVGNQELLPTVIEVAFCGNGVADATRVAEACDDGDEVEGDECDSNCTFPACGNGIPDPGEACHTLSGSFPAGSLVLSAVIEDIDLDGLGDVLALDSQADTLIFFKSGSEGLDAPRRFGVGGLAPSDLTVSDFNGDSLLDVATVNVVSNDVSILLGNGEGGFSFLGTFANPDAANSIGASDFDSDGDVDVILSGFGVDGVILLFNDGLGNLTSSIPFRSGAISSSLVVADFNFDNHFDVALAEINNNQVAVFLGNNEGGFFLPPQRVGIGARPEDIASADIDGDFDNDLITANFGSTSNTGEIGLALNQGNGDFSAISGSDPNRQSDENPFRLALADLDVDRDVDVIAIGLADGDGFEIFINNGSANFTAPVETTFPSPVQLVSGDVNGDTVTDLLFVDDKQLNNSGLKLFLSNP
jgi:hypothetical protein